MFLNASAVLLQCFHGFHSASKLHFTQNSVSFGPEEYLYLFALVQNRTLPEIVGTLFVTRLTGNFYKTIEKSNEIKNNTQSKPKLEKQIKSIRTAQKKNRNKKQKKQNQKKKTTMCFFRFLLYCFVFFCFHFRCFFVCVFFFHEFFTCSKVRSSGHLRKKKHKKTSGKKKREKKLHKEREKKQK